MLRICGVAPQLNPTHLKRDSSYRTKKLGLFTYTRLCTDTENSYVRMFILKFR